MNPSSTDTNRLQGIEEIETDFIDLLDPIASQQIIVRTFEVVSDWAKNGQRFYLRTGKEFSDLQHHNCSYKGWLTVYLLDPPKHFTRAEGVEKIGQFIPCKVGFLDLVEWFHDEGYEELYNMYNLTHDDIEIVNDSESTSMEIDGVRKKTKVRSEAIRTKDVFFEHKPAAIADATKRGVAWFDAFPYFLQYGMDWYMFYVRDCVKIKLRALNLLLVSEGLDRSCQFLEPMSAEILDGDL